MTVEDTKAGFRLLLEAITELRADVQQGFDGVRHEVSSSFKMVTREMNELRAAIVEGHGEQSRRYKQLAEKIDEQNERLSSVERKQEGLRCAVPPASPPGP